MVQEKDNFKPIYIEDMGGFNGMPTPYREGRMEDYWEMKFHEEPQNVEFKQIPIKGVYRDVIIEYYHTTAFALVQMIERNNTWVEVFEVGCEHDITARGVGRCLTEYRCQKCGLRYTIDSSD